MENPQRKEAKGRAAQIRPPNRFETIHSEEDFEHRVFDEDDWVEPRRLATVFLSDASRSIISENDSPDVPFRYSLNPYRGCEHGCAYCYARPGHEYLGFDAGLDFETKIVVKFRAAELFWDRLARSDWRVETIAFSGVTDCYQPAERRFRLTRACLQVALEAGQPIGIITKNALVTRDLDILRAMAKRRIIHVAVSINTLDDSLSRTMEPRTSPPAARLRIIRQLSEQGVPAGVMVAPVIPGLNDSEIPEILRVARLAGARSAGYVLLRLPLTVRPVFLDWLQRTQPTKAARVESLIRSTRDGKLNESQFGSRMRGSGQIARMIQQTFDLFAHKHSLNRKLPALETSHFRPPRASSGQLTLF